MDKPLDGTVVGRSKPVGRRRTIPENVVSDTPFLRVTPSGVQATLNRDLLAALGRPSHVLWVIPEKPPNGKQLFRLVAANVAVAGAYVVTYSRRLTAIVTVPAAVRLLGTEPRRYWASAWSKSGAPGPRFVDFPVDAGHHPGIQ